MADHKILAKPATMPREQVAREPRTVRDMAVGEESYLDSFGVVTSEKVRRVFVVWDASLGDPPENADDQPASVRRNLGYSAS